MEELIRSALGNFTLTFFVLGLIAAADCRRPQARRLHAHQRRRGAARLLHPVLDRLQLPLQLRLPRLLRRACRQLHRLGRQSVPGRGRLCQPRLRGGGPPRLQEQLHGARRRDPRPDDVPVGRRHRPHPRYARHRQHGARQRRRHFLFRHPAAARRLCTAVVQTRDRCIVHRFRAWLGERIADSLRRSAALREAKQ